MSALLPESGLLAEATHTHSLSLSHSVRNARSNKAEMAIVGVEENNYRNWKCTAKALIELKRS